MFPNNLVAGTYDGSNCTGPVPPCKRRCGRGDGSIVLSCRKSYGAVPVILIRGWCSVCSPQERCIFLSINKCIVGCSVPNNRSIHRWSFWTLLGEKRNPGVWGTKLQKDVIDYTKGSCFISENLLQDIQTRSILIPLDVNQDKLLSRLLYCVLLSL